MENYEIAKRIEANINSVFVGKESVVENLLICLFAGGHVLLANALARSVECSFGRIQFTPDTLPGDILGVSVYNMKTGEFEYREGVVMNRILLADEINRTSPKTQASLLEAMAEQQVTIDGKVYELPNPFMVIATQNPVEYLGTYPLPEAQMDRFMMRLSVGYPDREQEIRMVQQHLQGIVPERAEKVCQAEDILQIKEEVCKITVSKQVLSYIEDLIDLTRKEPRFVLGASPRATLALVRASQGCAFMRGRDYVKPDDVKQIADKVLLHRLTLTSEARIRKEDAVKVLQSLVIKAKVPVA